MPQLPICRYFNTAGGCARGRRCRWRHELSGETDALASELNTKPKRRWGDDSDSDSEDTPSGRAHASGTEACAGEVVINISQTFCDGRQREPYENEAESEHEYHGDSEAESEPANEYSDGHASPTSSDVEADMDDWYQEAYDEYADYLD